MIYSVWIPRDHAFEGSAWIHRVSLGDKQYQDERSRLTKGRVAGNYSGFHYCKGSRLEVAGGIKAYAGSGRIYGMENGKE